MAKTKIFISSVAEPALVPLRREAARRLTELGHEPLMWEESFGPWTTSVNPVRKCLEMVEASDIYLLFVGKRSGTYYPEAQRSVTHMEFIKAQDKGKLSLVFVDVSVKAAYFSTVKWRITEFGEHITAENQAYPEPTAIMDYLQQLEEVPKDVDPYTWYLLYDMDLRGVYMDDLAPGVPIDWSQYCSDLLRRGSLLLPLKDSFIENGERLEQYDDAFTGITSLLPHMSVVGFQDVDAFLQALMGFLPGGSIRQHYASYMTEEIGRYSACCAATLYRRDEGKMKYVGNAGATDTRMSFRLEDKTSFVALTYGMRSSDMAVYFKEERQMFYFCIRSGEYVLTLHFRSEPPAWNARTYMQYQEYVNDAIINKNPVMLELIKLLLGGLRHEA